MTLPDDKYLPLLKQYQQINGKTKHLTRYACFIPLSGYDPGSIVSNIGIDSFQDLDKLKSYNNELTPFELQRASVVNFIWHYQVAINQFWHKSRGGGDYRRDRNAVSGFLKWVQSSELQATYFKREKDKRKKKELEAEEKKARKEAARKERQKKKKSKRVKLNVESHPASSLVKITKLESPKMRMIYDGGSNIQTTCNLLSPILPQTIQFHDS